MFAAAKGTPWRVNRLGDSDSASLGSNPSPPATRNPSIPRVSTVRKSWKPRNFRRPLPHKSGHTGHNAPRTKEERRKGAVCFGSDPSARLQFAHFRAARVDRQRARARTRVGTKTGTIRRSRDRSARRGETLAKPSRWRPWTRGPDIAPYHYRQIAIIYRADRADWLDPSLSAKSVLKSLRAGSLPIEQVG
jgi:hypothetical protein